MKLKLSEMEKRCEAATPGEWNSERENVHSGNVCTCHGDKEGWYEVWTAEWGNGIDQKANADFIAHARTEHPQLISWARRARPFLQLLNDLNYMDTIFLGEPEIAKLEQLLEEVTE